MKKPRLRTVEKYKPPYPLNSLPKSFPYELAREVSYLLCTRVTPRLEGPDWEEIFTRLIGGRWKPSNVGLDDVLLERTAWSAKTVKASRPSKQKIVRLICGRNSPTYSYEVDEFLKADPAKIGEMVINIWNERVTAVMAKYDHLRTVVLIKSDDLLELAAFETDTVRYDADRFEWSWNKNSNLVGMDRATGLKRFTWQPSGSQFTINEEVPPDRLALRLKQPPPLDRDKLLETIQFDASWVELLP